MSSEASNATAADDQLVQAQTLHRQGQATAARHLYESILQAHPDHFEALNALGALAGQANELDAAIQYFDRAIAAHPGNPAPHINRGSALKRLGQPEAALASFDRAIALNGNETIAHYGRAETYRDMGHRDAALASYDRAVAGNPQFFQANFRRATLLQEIGALTDAVSAYDQTILVAPLHADAHANKGMALFRLRRFAEAVSSFDEAIAIRPDQAVTHLFRGNALKELQRVQESLASYDRAIAIDPNYVECHVNRGVLLFSLGRIEDALASYASAIAIKPDCAEAYFNRAYLHRTCNRFAAAHADYQMAARLAPDIDYLPGARLEVSLQTCEWTEFDLRVAEITEGVSDDRAASHPFNLLAVVDSPRLQLHAAQIWVRHACPADDSLGPLVRRTPGQKLRIGYFSADFREHPLYHLLAELLETHDRSRFEIIGFAFGPPIQDEPRRRLVAAFDRFIDVQEMSNIETAILARSLEVDIAVDLGGYTYNGRTGIFALRAAPLQINYLGYLGTLGASYMDYIIGDRTVVTAQSEPYFAEKIIYLPHSFQVNDRKRAIADRRFTRAELGLPASGCVFCCLNGSYKIQPDMFASWMRILKRTPGSVLMLVSGTEALAQNLRLHATLHAVDPRRLIFVERLPPSEYLARYRVADLFLDTHPYNAGTTASDALWAGLPVLTMAGEAFAARVGASLLEAIGLPELIAMTRQEYEDRAVELALNEPRLAGLKAALAKNRATSPLFDTDRFRRNIERAYVNIHDRYHAGLPPGHINVSED
jgi:predicted O-linked N-acetylglucosamine transferase (SPINDLY family)